MTEVVIPPQSACSMQIEQRLHTCNVGDVVEWAELEAATSLPRDVVRNLVMRARRKLERDHRLFFLTVPGRGVERIGETSVVATVLPSQRRAVARSARRMVKTTRHLDLTTLTASERATALAHQTLGIMTEVALRTQKAVALASSIEREQRLSPMTAEEAAQALLVRR